MRTFPLIRTKWSNEHFMAFVFVVLILYHLPQFIKEPSSIFVFLLIEAVGLLIDVSVNIVRYKHVVCSVSAAVTAAMISLFSEGIPIWGKLLGVTVALLIGKHIFGGTGKNIVNPAITGFLFLLLLFQIQFPVFHNSYLLLPAILLSIPFLAIRPYAGTGFLLGSILALSFGIGLSVPNILTYGIIFWNCLVITDPVTVTNHPFFGSILGLLTGVISLSFFDSPIAVVSGILLLNLASYVVDHILYTKKSSSLKPRIKLGKAVPYTDIEMVDLTEKKNVKANAAEAFSREEVLKRIKDNDVFGMGGAGFSTYQKINTLINSKADRKYLIINGAECDPGLIHDYWLLRTFSEEIGKGVKLVEQCAEFTNVILAVKDDSGLNFPGIKIHKLQDAYPVGAEKIVIQEVLNQKVNHNMVPAMEGILVINVQTVYSIYLSVTFNQKVTERFLTIADLKNGSAKVARVKLGDKIYEVLEKIYPNLSSCFAGGGIMQAYIADEDSVIDKNVNMIAISNFPKYKESPQCSNCGECIRSCPAGLMVNKIANLVDQGKFEETRKYKITECISCGSCSYRCPAGRNLAARLKEAKKRNNL